MVQVLSFGRDDIGYLSGLKIPSCTSPRIPSRSSSRLSLFDEFDDSEIVYPFAEDDEDLTGACNRYYYNIRGLFQSCISVDD